MEKSEVASLVLIFVGMFLAIIGPSFDLFNTNPIVSIVVAFGWILAIIGLVIFYSFRGKARAKAKKPPLKHRFAWIDKNAEKLIFATSIILLLFTVVLFAFGLFWNFGSGAYVEWMYVPLLVFGFLFAVSFFLYPVLYFFQIYLIERHAENHQKKTVFWGMFAVLLPMIAGFAYLNSCKKENSKKPV